MRTKGGTRYFNQQHIKKLSNIKNILFEEGKHNYSLDLVNKIISSKKLDRKINDRVETSNKQIVDSKGNNVRLNKIINKLKLLVS